MYMNTLMLQLHINIRNDATIAIQYDDSSIFEIEKGTHFLKLK